MNPVLIPDRIYFRIGDVAEIVGVKPYVIRFWEGEFPFLAPEKAKSGQRVYRRPQIESLILVKHLLHVERYSIEGAKKKLTELRRDGKMKETIMKFVAPSPTPAKEKEGIQIGSLVPKEDLSVSLQEKVNELQKLIRDPETQGIAVPGLKPLL
jgi:DNA-binding transcriptional MerR regulator